MAKVLVTGGAGFIGHHLVNALVERGDQVVVVDNLAGGDFPSRRNERASYIYFDITASDKVGAYLQHLCDEVKYVFHLAALPRVQASIDDPVKTARTNVIGTVAVLSAAQKAGVKRVVFASSSSVYGDSDKLPLTEDMIPSPMSPYARHKLQGEEYCMDFAKEPFNLETVCLRFFNVYGSGADPNGAYALVIAKFLEQKRIAEAMTITGDGTQTRDFTHVRDVVRGILAAAESPYVGKGEPINLGGGRQISVNRVAELVGGPSVFVPARLEPHDTLASIEKAERLLGWKPLVSFEEGMAELQKLNHA